MSIFTGLEKKLETIYFDQDIEHSVYHQHLHHYGIQYELKKHAKQPLKTTTVINKWMTVSPVLRTYKLRRRL